jgi:hypothetical protein
MRILLLTACVLGFYSLSKAQEVPFIDSPPKATKRLGQEMFDNISKLLYAGKLAPHMKCEIKARAVREERKFTDGKRIVEVLQIEYYPKGIYSDTKVSLQLPEYISTYGTKQISNQWSGVGEDILIQAHDYYEHWVRFTHDGKGNLVDLQLGNYLTTYPCFSK